MLRKLFFSIVMIASVSLGITGCWDNHHNSTEPIYGSGNIVSVRRTVADCSGINIESVCDVYLVSGKEQSITIEADDNIIDQVITRKENGLLKVGLDDGEYSNVKVKAYVTLKTIQKLSITGAGNIYIQNAFNTDNLETIINGAGNINLKGESNYLNCVVNGAGNIVADQFIAKKVDAMVNGAGNCNVYAVNELNASIFGVGSIYYSGNPANVKTYINGVGRIIRK